MTVAELSIDARHPAAPGLCRVRVWPLPAASAHCAERGARTIVRDVLAAAGVRPGDVLETESIVAELAVNAVQHAAPPYELRIVFAGTVWPTWCEVADGGADVDRIRWRPPGGGAATTATSAEAVPELAEGGRGLILVGGLSGGRWAAYRTTLCQNNAVGKAVGFALPGAGRDGCEERP
jgi:anti-sigma regulatory factor (Ser/Thr protein kinase)